MTWEQTAEVLAREVDRLQKGIEQCIEWMNRPAEGADFSELEEMLEALVSPAAEGGGAANGGESKIPACPLCEKEMTPRKVFNSEDNLYWVMSVCDPCNVYSQPLYPIDPQKALDAAILALHILAGEFPTPIWKSREDYLQATISEINEILGK